MLASSLSPWLTGFRSPGTARPRTLFASDDVVRAFGDITNNQSRAEPVHPMVLWAKLLRAIRKSVGNKGTS